MRRLGLYLLCCLGLLILPASAQEALDKVKVLALPYLSFAPLHIAQQEGYYEKYGIEVEFLEQLEDETAFPALITGDLDVHIKLSEASLFNSIARGAQVRVVADKGHFEEGVCPSSAFIASQAALDGGLLDSAETFSQQQFSFETDDIEQYMLEMLLAKIGLEDVDTDALANESLPPPVLNEALITGTTQVASASEPWVTRAVQSGQVSVWYGYQDIVPEMQSSLLLYGPRLLETNPELGERFMAAYLEGVRQYQEGVTERNLEIINGFTGLDSELIESACWAEINADGSVLTDSMIDFQQWLFDRGLLDRILAVDEFYDPRFIEAASAMLEGS